MEGSSRFFAKASARSSSSRRAPTLTSSPSLASYPPSHQKLPTLCDLQQHLQHHTTFAALASLLKLCGQVRALSHGRLVHAHIRKRRYDWNTFLGNWLVKMYGDCGSMEDARSVFDNLAKVNLYSWNILMKAYAQNGQGREALGCFRQMQCSGVRVDAVSFVAALDACSCVGDLHQGQQIHAEIAKSGLGGEIIVANALVSMYGKCASLDDARRVFDQMAGRDTISWTAMITALSQNGHGKDALELFHQMQDSRVSPNPITFVCALDACASLVDLEEGLKIHAAIVEWGFEGRMDAEKGLLNMHNALVNMYGKCGSVEHARSVFGRMHTRTVASWTAMITACAQNGESKEALNLFDEMQFKGIIPDQITFVSVLDACTALAALEKGREIHASIVGGGYEHQVVVGTALINLYGKCGYLEDARVVFLRMPVRDVVSWNAMIAACAHNGHGSEALDLFDQMQCDGFKPNHVTFLSILAACSHIGRVDAAMGYYNSMSENHGLTPKVEHNVCLIDILGRAGLLDDAEDLISSMPVESKARVWLCLLSACRIHGDVKRGARAASNVFKLDPENHAPFVILSNIYAAAGRYDDAQQMRGLMNSTRLKKIDHFNIEGDKMTNEFFPREMVKFDNLVHG